LFYIGTVDNPHNKTKNQKKDDMSRPVFRKKDDSQSQLSNYVFLAFLIGVFYLFYLVIRPFLADIFIAIVMAMVLYPLYTFLRRIFKGWKVLSALTAIFIAVLVFLIPFSLLSGLITSQSLDFYQTISKGLKDGSFKRALDLKLVSINLFFERWQIDIQSLRVEEYIGKFLQTFSEFVYNEMTDLAKGIVGIIFDMIIVLFITFFLLIDGERFLHEIKTLSPLEVTHHDRIIRQLERTTKATLKGSIIVALVQGFLGGLGFWIFDIPSSAFWGVCMVFSSVIPLVGTSIIWVPAAFYLAFTSSFWMAIGLALWGTLIISGADNVLRPLLLKEGANLHPLLTFLSVLGGLIYFGFLGFILGPIVLSFLMTLFDIYKNEFLVEK
jgi:predicted PurR-regulated permease PerM